MPHKKISQYKAQAATTASPNVQIALVLQKAAQHMAKALLFFHEGKIEERYKESDRAIVILTALVSVLDCETPETKKMSKILSQYYGQMMTSISEFNINQDSVKAQLVIDSLQEMAATWRGLLKPVQTKEEEAMAVAPEESLENPQNSTNRIKVSL